MLKRNSIILGLALLVTTLSMSVALAGHYEIQTGGKSEIIFKSKAPMEKFDGKTKQLSGSFDADLSNLSGPVFLVVEIDLASFDTGMKKRNKHMRENHLETEKYPKAWFRAGSIKQSSKSSLSQGETATIVLAGTLDLHGVKKDHDVTLEIFRGNDDSLTITGQFPVLLSEHAIDRPKFLVMKLADEQLVFLNLLARLGS